MTSKLKCPFCGEELDTENYYVRCRNPYCNETVEMDGTEEIWQALIESHKSLVLSEQSADREIHRLRDLLSQSQKKFEIARQWLEEIVENHRHTPITTAEMALKELDDDK